MVPPSDTALTRVPSHRPAPSPGVPVDNTPLRLRVRVASSSGKYYVDIYMLPRHLSVYLTVFLGEATLITV
jgi:hypothetical protein